MTAGDNNRKDDEPSVPAVSPPTQLPAVVTVLSCALILAAFVGVFFLLQMRSSGPFRGWRTKLPSVYSDTQVGFGFVSGRGDRRKARICYKGIPTVWGDEDAVESESDSEDVEGHGERKAFIKTQSSI